VFANVRFAHVVVLAPTLQRTSEKCYSGWMNAAIYVRISKDPEGEALGVERQRQDCLRLCRDRGWKVVGVYEDNDVSAFSGKRRPAYQDLLKAVVAGDVNKIVIYTSSRLVRNKSERNALFEILREKNAGIVPVQGPELDLSSATGRMLADLLGAFDTMEVEIKSERHKREVIQRAEQGKSHGGSKTFGLQRDDVTLDATESEQIRKWYTLVIAGSSLMSVAREAGMHHSSVKRILKNPRNMGIRVLHGKEYAAPNPAIVPESTWRAAVAILDNPSRNYSHGNSYKWFGSGLYVCRECDLPVGVYYSAKSIRMYRCTSCYRWWTAEPIDRYVTEATAEWLGRYGPQVSRPSERKNTEGLILEARSVRVRLEQLGAEFASDDTADLVEFRSAAKGLRERLATLEDKIASSSSVDAVASLGGSPEAFLKLKDPRRKRAVVEAVMTIELEPSPKGKGRAGWFGAKVSWNDESGEPQRAPHVTTAV